MILNDGSKNIIRGVNSASPWPLRLMVINMSSQTNKLVLIMYQFQQQVAKGLVTKLRLHHIRDSMLRQRKVKDALIPKVIAGEPVKSA